MTSQKNPVILVHGIHNTCKTMRHIEQHLRSNGWEVYSINLVPNSGKVGLDELAIQLNAFVNQHILPTQKVDLIGFSMGGLVCRYYVQRLGGLSRVERFITISSPHHGTMMAYLSGNTGAKQMRMNSAFLRNLNADIDVLKTLSFTSIWTPLDLMIVPASSSHVPIGDEIKIWSLLHPLIVQNKRCLHALKCLLLK